VEARVHTDRLSDHPVALDPPMWARPPADLSLHFQAEIDMVAMEINGRPRKTLGWRKPIEVYAEMLEAARDSMTD